MKKKILLTSVLMISMLSLVTGCKKKNDIKINDKYFGYYPQKRETNVPAILKLTTKAGTLPTSTNTYNWTDYGYYIADENYNPIKQSYMYYIDIDLDNDSRYDYRGVYFTEYRTYSSCQDDNGYNINTVYWFKYEPIKWNILYSNDGKALIVADLILDSQGYNYTVFEQTIGGKTVYANNYEYSHIRSWLNDTFYNTAFNSLEKSIIETTLVDNSLKSTGDGTNKYVCNNTNDKIFLLSVEEVNTYYASDDERKAQGTDYANAQGLSVSTNDLSLGNSNYLLRSPSYVYGDNYAYYVIDAGSINDRGDVSRIIYGVRPACWINL